MSALDHPTLASLRASYSQANFIQTKSQLVAFYVKNYIITRAVDTLKTERGQGKDVTELTKEVQAWFQDLESIKTALGAQIQNQDQSRMQYQDYTSYWFMKARSQYQTGNYSQQLADDLATVILLYDAYNIFNSPNQDIDNNKNFAKTAHQTVINSLQKNPNAGKHSQNPYQSTPGNPYQSTPGYNPYQSHNTPYGGQSQNTPYGDTPNPGQSTHNQQQNQGPFQGFQVAESTFVPKSSVDQKKSMMNQQQQQQPIPDNNAGAFQGFQVAESTFVPKSSVDQKKSMMNQQQAQSQHPQSQPQNQDNAGAFQGFQAAESTFIPQSSMDQRKSMMNQQQQQQGGQPQNQPFSTGIVNSVYSQGPPQNFQQSYGHPQGQQQSGYMPPHQQNFHQSQQPYGGYNPYQQSPHGFSQGPQGGNFNMPEQHNPVNQSRNIAQSGISHQAIDAGLVGLPDFTKFEDPMKGQSVNPYQAQNNQNVGVSQNPYNNQQAGNNPYGGQSTNLKGPNNTTPNPYAGGYDPMASKAGGQNAGGNPYGGGMNVENTGNANDVKKSVVNNTQGNIRETNTPQPQDIRRADVKPMGNINIPTDKQHQLKELVLMAVSELDYKNVREAKDDIRKALEIIRQYE